MDDDDDDDDDHPELYVNIQSVPRSKHTPSQLYKPVNAV
jgi:hypothetical protein